MKIPYLHTTDVHNYIAPREVIPFIIELLSPNSLLDVGCGLGHWLAAAAELGVTDIRGIDGDYIDKTQLVISKEHFEGLDLTRPFDIDRSFDLVISLEVAEHLPPESAEGFIDSICKHGNTVLFSAAIPKQGGQNHLNEQWPSYWSTLFEQRGFKPYDILRPRFWNNQNVNYWYRQNMILYSRDQHLRFPEGLPSFGLLPIVHPDTFFYKDFLYSRLKDETRNPKGIRRAGREFAKALRYKIFKFKTQK